SLVTRTRRVGVHVPASETGPRRVRAAVAVEGRRIGPAPPPPRVRAQPVPVAGRDPPPTAAPPALPPGARLQQLPLLPRPPAPRPLRPERPVPPRRPARPAAAGKARDPGARRGDGRAELAARRPDPQPDRRLAWHSDHVPPQSRPQVLARRGDAAAQPLGRLGGRRQGGRHLGRAARPARRRLALAAAGP